MVKKLLLLAAVVGLTALPVSAQTKTDTSCPDNQVLADAVKEQLSGSSAVRGAKIDIETKDGKVILNGTVVDEKQHLAILKEMTKVKGIKKVESNLMPKDEIRRVGGQAEASPMVMPPLPTMPSTLPGGFGPVATPVAGAAPGGSADPVPLNGGAMAPIDPVGPKMPPYAWPSYAPYNNYSRVAYPQTYPYNAFPYIGPYYPFPKVPLGWRKVTLEWEDGHWFLGRMGNPYDYWRVKFW